MISPRHLYTARPPRQLSKHIHSVRTSPSIPVADLAWGYEENDQGILRLQRPENRPMPWSLRGPGSYTPSTALTLPSAPEVDFGRSSGRDKLRKDFPMSTDPPAADWETGSGDSSADYGISHTQPTSDLNPSTQMTAREARSKVSPRQAMPIAANLLRCQRPPRPARTLKTPQPPTPGPGAFECASPFPQQLRTELPQQMRHFNRTPLASPLHSQHRTVPPEPIGSLLHVRTAKLAAACLPPPLIKHPPSAWD